MQCVILHECPQTSRLETPCLTRAHMYHGEIDFQPVAARRAHTKTAMPCPDPCLKTPSGCTHPRQVIPAVAVDTARLALYRFYGYASEDQIEAVRSKPSSV